MVSCTTKNLIQKDILKAHSSEITCLEFCENSKLGPYLISSSTDSLLRIWQPITDSKNLSDLLKMTELKLLKELAGHKGAINDFKISNCGNYVITASSDTKVALWFLVEGEARFFEGHKGEVKSISFSQDNRIIISGDQDAKVLIWNVLGILKYTIDSHSCPIKTCKFLSIPAPILLSIDDSGTFYCSDLSNYTPPSSSIILKDQSDSEIKIQNFTISPKCDLLAACSSDTVLVLAKIIYSDKSVSINFLHKENLEFSIQKIYFFNTKPLILLLSYYGAYVFFYFTSIKRYMI